MILRTSLLLGAEIREHEASISCKALMNASCPVQVNQILVNGCYDISLNITEKPFSSVPFEVHFVISPAPSLDDRPWIFFLSLFVTNT